MSEPPSRRRRYLAAGAIALASLAAIAIVLAGSRSPSRTTVGAGVPAGATTATVTRRTLSESQTIDGTLGYGATRAIYARLGGTFTWLPAVGDVIGRGGTLYRLDNRPIVLMYGNVPAYRTMKLGTRDGPDILELNRNLVSLGFDPYGAVSTPEHFSEATVAAVKRWQHAESLPETGIVQLGRVSFAADAVRVTTVHVALGQDPPGSSEEAPEAGAEQPAAKHDSPAEEEKQQRPAAKQSPAESPAAKDKAAEEAAADKSAAEADAAKKAESEGAGGGGAGTLVLSASATRQIVTIKVKAEQQQLAHVGEIAPVTLPGGRLVHGRVIEVGKVASAASEEEKSGGEGGEGATIPVTIALRRPVAHLDQAPVSVQLVKSARRRVLTVPAGALIATAGGGYAIQSPRAGRPVEVLVTPGMFADGYVEVEGPGVHAGLTVLEPR